MSDFTHAEHNQWATEAEERRRDARIERAKIASQLSPFFIDGLDLGSRVLDNFDGILKDAEMMAKIYGRQDHSLWEGAVFVAVAVGAAIIFSKFAPLAIVFFALAFFCWKHGNQKAADRRRVLLRKELLLWVKHGA